MTYSSGIQLEPSSNTLDHIQGPVVSNYCDPDQPDLPARPRIALLEQCSAVGLGLDLGSCQHLGPGRILVRELPEPPRTSSRETSTSG